MINVHPSMKNLLSHRVFPIPPRMLSDLWDYGSLSSATETKYVHAMLSQLGLEQRLLDYFVEAVIMCQNFIKQRVEKEQSSVSLRDIKRVVRIFRFYDSVVRFRELIKNKQDELKKKSYVELDSKFKTNMDFEKFCAERRHEPLGDLKDDDFLRVFTITVLVNYIFRIHKSGRPNSRRQGRPQVPAGEEAQGARHQ